MEKPAIARREVYTSFIDSFLRISQIRSHLSRVVAVVRAPSETITVFLDDPATTPRHAFDFFATSFAYYVVAAALYSLAASTDNMAMFLSLVIGLIIVSVGTTALYEFFTQTSEEKRRFTDHMIIYTLVLGAAVMIAAIGFLPGIIFAPLGWILMLIALIWALVMLVLLFSRYWEIPQSTVAVYTIGVGVVTAGLSGLLAFVLFRVL